MNTKKLRDGGLRFAPGMVGPAALIAAVIATAVVDCHDENPKIRQDATGYFCGETYREHLDWLGLPVDWIPEALEGIG